MTDNERYDLSILNDIDQWQSVDDLVMGGKSRSRLSLGATGGIVFAGTLCNDEGSGFASIRSNTHHFDLSQYAGLMLRLKGDGRRYKVSLRCAADFDGISYQVTFPTSNATVQTIPFSWDVFIPSYHGRVLASAPALDPAEIRSLGFIVADGQAGSFQLEIYRIEVQTGRLS